MTRRIPAAAALLALLTALCVVTAMAAGAAVELPVRVTVSGDAPDVPEVFTLTLRAASDGAPLPEGSRNGRVYLRRLRRRQRGADHPLHPGGEARIHAAAGGGTAPRWAVR